MPPVSPGAPPNTSLAVSNCSRYPQVFPKCISSTASPDVPHVPRWLQLFPGIPKYSPSTCPCHVPRCPSMSPVNPQGSLAIPRCPHIPGVSKCCQVSPCPQVSLSDFLPCPQVSPHVFKFPHVPTHPKLSSSVPRYFQVSPRVHVPCVPVFFLCSHHVLQRPDMSLCVFKCPQVSPLAPPCVPPSLC